MTSQDLAVPDESRGRQAFGEGVSHHFVRAQRHEFDESSQDENAHSTDGYRYDKRTFGAPDFRSSQHKQGCLRTEEWLEFQNIQNRLTFPVCRFLLSLLG